MTLEQELTQAKEMLAQAQGDLANVFQQCEQLTLDNVTLQLALEEAVSQAEMYRAMYLKSESTVQ